MDLRQRNIDKHLLEAHQFKEKAETALKAYQNALKKATDKASQSLERTQAELNEFIARRQSELTESLNQKIANGEAEIKKSKEEALTKVREISEDLALDIIKKIGIKEISAKDIENTSRTIMKEN